MAEVRQLIKTLGDGRRTVLLASHLLNEVEQVCDRVAILSKGRVIAEGPVRDLLARRNRLRVTTTDDERAAAILRRLDWLGPVTATDAGLLVGAATARAWEVTAALAAEDVYVSELRALDTSLEEYFLEVTGEEAAP